MKKWMMVLMILSAPVFVEAAAKAEAKADWLANIKKNMEGRGKKYDPAHFSAAFDAIDLDKDGILTPEELTAHKASRKKGAPAKKGSPEKTSRSKKKVVSKEAPVSTIISSSAPAPEGYDPATDLWFNQPAQRYYQSLVLGNGRIGAMVFGGPDEERIVLNEESLWSGSRVENNVPGGYKYLPEMRRLLGEEKFGEAGALKRKIFPIKGAPKYGKGISPFGRYQTLGNLRLKFSGNSDPVDDYRRELDLNSALGNISYRRGATSFKREHFVSAPDDVFVSRLTGPVSFTVTMDREEHSTTTVVNDRELLMTGSLNDGFGGKGMTYVGRLRVVGGSVKAEGNKLVVSADDDVVLLFAAATDYRGIAGRQLSDPLAATTSDLDKVEKKTFDEMRAAQKTDHEKYFNRVTLNLPETKNSRLPTDKRLAAYKDGASDPVLEALFFNMGRYLLISSSRPGGLPGNLQGIWAEEIHTMWNGDYHFNINAQMVYWPAQTCNLAELQEPFNNYIASLVEPGTKTAKAYYNSPGWFVHRMSNIWGFTAPSGMDMGCAAWLCEHLWDQYAFTLDKEYLTKVYTIMKGSVEFYLDNLFEEPDNKWLVTGPSQSPETGFILPNGTRGSLCLGPTIDMQQLRELFGNTVQAARILGVDKELQDELLAKRKRLAPNQIAPDGLLQEWLKPYEGREPTHRHLSPFYGLYPYNEITPESTPELAEACRKLLKQRAVGQSGGFSNAWKVNLFARLGEAEKAWEFVRRMLTDNGFDNMMSRFRPLLRADGKPEKILLIMDANFGTTAGIAEMLMQSHPKSGEINAEPIIHLLPALPKAWHEGSISGLRARGGFEVDVGWEDGKLIECKITSLFGNPVKVRYGSETKQLNLKKGESRTLSFGQIAEKSTPFTNAKPLVPDATISQWNGYDRYNFSFKGYSCFITQPKKALPSKPWVWRAKFPGYHDEIDEILVGRGFHVAHIRCGPMLGSPKARDLWDEFYSYVTETVGLNKIVALEAVSRGGLFAYGWAANNPEKVSCIYGNVPVLDFKSWPGGKGKGVGSSKEWANLHKQYGITEEQAMESEDIPLNKLEPLAKAGIPIMHVVSLVDKVVPADENSLILEEKYRALGGSITVLSNQKGKYLNNGHRFPLDDPERYANFIQDNTLIPSLPER